MGLARLYFQGCSDVHVRWGLVHRGQTFSLSVNQASDSSWIGQKVDWLTIWCVLIPSKETRPPITGDLWAEVESALGNVGGGCSWYPQLQELSQSLACTMSPQVPHEKSWGYQNTWQSFVALKIGDSAITLWKGTNYPIIWDFVLSVLLKLNF